MGQGDLDPTVCTSVESGSDCVLICRRFQSYGVRDGVLRVTERRNKLLPPPPPPPSGEGFWMDRCGILTRLFGILNWQVWNGKISEF